MPGDDPLDLDWQLYDGMPHQVTIYASAGRNNYGEHTQGQDRKRRAYLPPRIFLAEDGLREVNSRPVTAVIADTEMQVGDQVEWPDGTVYEVAAIEVHDYKGTEGLEHSVVQFK